MHYLPSVGKADAVIRWVIQRHNSTDAPDTVTDS